MTDNFPLPALDIPSWTNDNERELLAELARDAESPILEVGCLYGGTTAVLASANPDAKVYSIDDFSWTPTGYPTASADLTKENLARNGITNVTIIESDSRKTAKTWKERVGLLWIDGGHSFEYVYSDLYNFGPLADVIALHDYGNPFWPTIQQAVEAFMKKFPDQWRIDKVVGSVCVLRRN